MLRRVVDASVSLCLLVLLSPLMLCVMAISFCVFRRDIFYCSERLGLGKKSFPILKFRSMQSWSAEQLEEYFCAHPEMRRQWLEMRKLNPDPRCSGWGAFLRRSSLDELPQLVNVLRGEMALVGPRPITEEEIQFYGRYANMLHSVKPGITGLWQVSGRNELTYHRRVAINLYYVRHRSWKLDLWILYRTVWVVITGKGAY